MADKKSYQSNITDWQEHINSYRSSGKSKAAYCLSQGLKLKQFEYHYRRWYENYREEQELSKYPPLEFTPVIVTSSKENLNQSENIDQSTFSSPIEVQLSNGISCRVQANFCKITMKQLMELSL